MTKTKEINGFEQVDDFLKSAGLYPSLELFKEEDEEEGEEHDEHDFTRNHQLRTNKHLPF